MNIEHFALNVNNPAKMAEWYVDHLGMRIVRQRDEPPFTTFLSDSADNVMLEIYCNPENEVPDYPNMSPLIVHIAFSDDDPEATQKRLTAAGASFVEELHLPDGTVLLMMRDPWGIALQFCKRAVKNQ